MALLCMYLYNSVCLLYAFKCAYIPIHTSICSLPDSRRDKTDKVKGMIMKSGIRTDRIRS